MNDEMKTCDRCKKGPAVAGERYCPRCRNDVLYEARKAGMTTFVPRNVRRPDEARERLRDTRHGIDDWG
jgi:hypothetical protein